MENLKLKSLHIISFDVPYPANYGGVIDVFYKLKQLHKLGVKITLHCFEYGRGEQKVLEQYCEKVFYYKRKTLALYQVSRLPYIVRTRLSEELLNNLLRDKHPILFEGLHTCGILANKRLAKRMKIYRESNIEHDYYRQLANAEKSSIKKMYFRMEARKLEKFEAVLYYANKMLVVSTADEQQLKHRFPKRDIEYLPSFHPYEKVEARPGKGTYILYHGNLSIGENILGVTFLIDEVFKSIKYPVKIAGLNPGPELKEKIKAYPHIELIENPDDETLQALIKNAHINCLYTHQATGLKLKLLNALFAGRHCLVNELMLHGTALHPACSVANTAEALLEKIRILMQKEFGEEELELRRNLLSDFDVQKNAARIAKLV